ncbi:flagellar basal body rod protein [Hylemonella gracilis str. Niagara R]|uniref:Flagellar basal body rod protein n=1 Tax=Hylemonella gracilis str. Niagara R TaxID=1458275 RepID=A0A016XJY4_9BURK|nr:flagellar basal body rod C-terminal domain-containing protein [Hylemonella gracilis]EYC52409.1 flagellar basal body rod protein [Hylemonella gracilis str. Niagara R]
MASLSSIGISGLQAAQLRLDSAAHNVANLNTNGFRRQTVTQADLPDLSGTRASVGKAEQEGVALEAEVVEQMSATYAFKANLKSIQTQDDVLGSLLDTRA